MLETRLISTTRHLYAISLISSSMKIKQFGARLKKEHKEQYSRSKHWNGKIFENISITTMDINLKTLPGFIQENFKGRHDRDPKEKLPLLAFNPLEFPKDGQTKYAWFGHSAAILQIANQNLLIDPMLGPDASPIGPVRTRRFSENSLQIIDQLPVIDAVFLTHDHYDHLDLASIEKLIPKVDTWFVALGVGRHLIEWGVAPTAITEFDWWEQASLGDLEITFTPSRHFSGRGPTDRAKSFWGGWVIKSGTESIYWSGDGGYDAHFKEIGERLGPFDLGFMECGQYNERWHHIHMYPEEAVQASLDAGVNLAIPVHWAGFTLALHNWKDPIQRFSAKAEEMGLKYQSPDLGRISRSNSQSNKWWEYYT